MGTWDIQRVFTMQCIPLMGLKFGGPYFQDHPTHWFIGLVIVSPRFVGLSTNKLRVTKVTNQLLSGMILQLLLHCCFGAAPRLRTRKHVSPYMPQNQHRASFWTWGIPSNSQMWMWTCDMDDNKPSNSGGFSCPSNLRYQVPNPY